MTPEQRRTRARIAATRRHHPDADVTELTRDLRASRAEDYVRKLVDEAPPLTNDQRARLTAIIGGSFADDGGEPDAAA